MLLSLAAALQVSAATVTPPLRVRVDDTVRAVAAVRHPEGGVAVSLAALADAVGGTVMRDRGGAGGARAGWRVRVDSLWMWIADGARQVVSGVDTLPLPATVFQRGDTAYVPDALATDVLPRLGVGVVYDSVARELLRIPLEAPAIRPGNPDPSLRPDGDDPAAGAPRRVVVLDPGHGGADAGMVGLRVNGRPMVEKEVTLAVALALRSALEARGVRVVMTRQSDTLVALADRGRLANAAHGALFLSLHVNAANPRWGNPGAVRGFEAYVPAEARTEDQRRLEALENAVVRFEGSPAPDGGDGALDFVMRDLATNAHLRASAELAALLEERMRTVHPGPSRGVQHAGFRVLLAAFMPAVLVELGYGSHPGDAAFLADPARQRALARALAEATVRFLDRFPPMAQAGR